MTPAHRAISEYDGWIFSATGNSVQKGRNGTNRRLTDLHYDRWEWLLPVYAKIFAQCDERHQKDLKNIQSAILFNDKEMVIELMGRLIMKIKKVEV